MLVEDDVHNALHLLELHRVERAGHFDVSVTFARDLEGKARAGKIRQSDVEVTDIAVVMCLDVALPAIQRLELALNDEIGLSGTRGSVLSSPGSSVSNET